MAEHETREASAMPWRPARKILATLIVLIDGDGVKIVICAKYRLYRHLLAWHRRLLARKRAAGSFPKYHLASGGRRRGNVAHRTSRL